MPDSPPPPLPPPPTSIAPTPMFNSIELDYLIYSYLNESGYKSTSNELLSESNHLQPNSDQLDSIGGGGHLVKLLQKGLLYSQAEHRYLNGNGTLAANKRIKLHDQSLDQPLHLPPLPKKISQPPITPLPQPITTTATTATQSNGKGKGKEKGLDKELQNEKKRKSSTTSTTPHSATTSDQEPEGKRSRITSNDDTAHTKGKGNGGGKAKGKGGKGKGKGKERQIDSDQSDGEQQQEAEGSEKEEEDTRMKDVMPAPSSLPLPIASTSKTSLPLPLPPPPPPLLPAPISESHSNPQSSKHRLPPPPTNHASNPSTNLPPPPLPLPAPSKRPQITSTLSSSSTSNSNHNSNSNSTSKRSQSPNQSRKPLLPPTPAPPAPPPPSPAPSSTVPAVSSGPAKIRITTTTRNVPTPQTSTSLPLSSSRDGQSPIVTTTSRSNTLTSNNDKKDSSEGGSSKKLMKVKNEESNGSALSGKLGGGKGSGGKELSKEELLAKQKRKREREVQREKEREKEKDNLMREREKEKEREREREREKEKERKEKERERERERESKVDMSRCKRVKSNDSSVIKLRGHTVAMVQPCSFNSKVPTLLATGGGDSTCRIWDVPRPTPQATPGEPTEEEHIVCKHASAQRKVGVAAVAWDPSGSLLATGSEDGIARIWTPSGDLHLVLSMHQRAINSLRWAPSGTLLLTGSLDSTVCLWELSSGKVRQQYGTHGDSILDVDWNDDSTFASASMDKTVHLFTTGRNNPIHRLKGHRDEVNVVKFSPCGTLVATCSDDHTVRIWSLRNLPALASTINSKSVKKGDENRKIDRDEDEDEDGEDGNERGCLVLKGHESEVHQISWKPGCGKAGSEGDGNRLIASCSFDHTAKLWDADEGTCLYTFSRHQDFVYSIAFEPTLGRFLATGSNDGTVMVWRIKDKALVLEYESPAPVYELTFNPPGTQIAVTGQLEQVAVVPFDGVTAFNS